MRLNLLILLILLQAGCIQPTCLDCDDDNPCTYDACVNGECIHNPLSGPVEGCYGSGGCVEYSCFSGECLPQKITHCCGNGVCDEGETNQNCARDCEATCFDSIQNQGEESVDCGGLCPRCEPYEQTYLKKIGFLHQSWYYTSENYTAAILSYNKDKNKSKLMSSAMESYGEVENIRDVLSKANTTQGLVNLTGMLNDTLNLYMQATHHMVIFTQSNDDNNRLTANRLFADSYDADRLFIGEYNRIADRFNVVQSKCSNQIFDVGEESTDCGGVCETPCEAIYNVTKYVLLRIEGGPVRMQLNISSPAVAYPPQQRLINSYVKPHPDLIESSPEGNQYYIYQLDMPSYGVMEFEITHTVRLSRAKPKTKSNSGYFSTLYLQENNFSRMTDDICYRANALQKGGNGTEQTVDSIQKWMIGNIRYELNQEELGAEYCYLYKKGACDEHADLFVSLARCVGIPSRRITGSLINASSLNGHAWSEYYDGGWVYVDPSVKKVNLAFAPDNKHITACLGEGAYHCGVGYSYTYERKKPQITVQEKTYMS
ncbi:MAG: transglutaminase-like domain-containing protein [Candidatus Altiarchaeota archaeon]